MDFSRPFRALTPTLDGPVLRALARVDTPMTRRQLTELVEDASEAGVRKVLGRLAGQGVVIEARIGAQFTYVANRDHLMWPAVEVVMSARRRLEEAIRERVSRWEIKPISVEIFGSYATGAADAESDIDVMVVRPAVDDDGLEHWYQQVDDLRLLVERWTGNSCEMLNVDQPTLEDMLDNGEPVLASPTISIFGAR